MLRLEAPAPAPIMLVMPDSSGENWLFNRSNLVNPEDKRNRIGRKIAGLEIR